MDAHEKQLRRLAVHDDALVEEISVDGGSYAASVVDERTAALLRVAAAVAVDAAPSTFQHAVAHALAAGATSADIVASLEAVTPVTGSARVVGCVPKSRSRSASTSKRRWSGATGEVHPIGMKTAPAHQLTVASPPTEKEQL